jgi:hypothetical protein
LSRRERGRVSIAGLGSVENQGIPLTTASVARAADEFAGGGARSAPRAGQALQTSLCPAVSILAIVAGCKPPHPLARPALELVRTDVTTVGAFVPSYVGGSRSTAIAASHRPVVPSVWQAVLMPNGVVDCYRLLWHSRCETTNMPEWKMKPGLQTK